MICYFLLLTFSYCKIASIIDEQNDEDTKTNIKHTQNVDKLVDGNFPWVDLKVDMNKTTSKMTI
jgi:hypothetical protein